MARDGWQRTSDLRTRSAPVAYRHREGRGSVRGVANDVSTRAEYSHDASCQVLTFSVDVFDPHNDRYVPVPVEMRGYALRGHVGNGHEVAVEGEYDDGTLRASHATNLTTGALVEARDVPRWAKRVLGVFFVLVLLVVVVVTVGVVATLSSGAGFGATF